jgi:hypothetical protein
MKNTRMTIVNYSLINFLLIKYYSFFIINMNLLKMIYLSKIINHDFFFFKKNYQPNNNLKFVGMISNDVMHHVTDDYVSNVTNKFFSFKNSKTIKIKSNLFFYNFAFFNYTIKNTFKLNNDWNLFFINDLLNNIVIINLQNFIKKWKISQNFIFNVFFYNFSPLLFGSKDFASEILSLNWNYFKIETQIWKYINIFFIFKNNSYSVKTKQFYNKINQWDIDFLFVSNSAYHWKNIFYFNFFKFFTIGPVSINLSPWILSYSIPVFNNHLLTEQFFIKLLILFEKNVLLIKHNLNKSIWFSHCVKQKIFLLK